MAFKTETQRRKGFSGFFCSSAHISGSNSLKCLARKREQQPKKQSMPVSFEKESSKKIICENTPLTLKAHS